MKFKMHYYLAIIFAIPLFFAACDNDDPEPENEEELITTMRMVFSPSTGGDDVVFEFNDPDGDGGADPTIQGGVLDTNATYDVVIELWNESVTPAVDIAEEVRDEGTEHQFFFATTEDLDLSFAYLDADDDGNPIGLETQFLAGGPGTGLFQVILRHNLDKDASGVSMGNITNAGGETDIQVEFPLDIQ